MGKMLNRFLERRTRTQVGAPDQGVFVIRVRPTRLGRLFGRSEGFIREYLPDPHDECWWETQG